MSRRFSLAVVVLVAMSAIVAVTARQEEVAVSAVRGPVAQSAADPQVDAGTAPQVGDTPDADAESDTPDAGVESDTPGAGVESDTPDAGVESDTPDAGVESDTVELVAELRQTPALPPARGLDDLVAAEAERAARTPVALTIERLGLNQTRIRAEGVEENGDMAVPPAREIGWYKFGPIPGEAGSAVLAGHVAFDGVDGAFRHLDDLEEGDRVVVDRQDGSTATFVVSDQVQVAKTNLPFDELFARSGPSRLALITCGGEFDYDSRSYSDNVVVIAELVDT